MTPPAITLRQPTIAELIAALQTYPCGVRVLTNIADALGADEIELRPGRADLQNILWLLVADVPV
jgi:hypothetical protein